MRFIKERKEVLRACMDLLKSGLVRTLGAEGNVSLKIEKDEDLFAITPSQTRYDTMDPEDVLIVNTEGEIVDKITDYKPSSETPTHTLIHGKMRKSKAVVHSHPPYSISLSLLYEKIPSVYLGQAYFFGSEIPIIDYVTAGTEEMAEKIVPLLEEYPGLIIQNHGLITIGNDLAEALQRTFVVEDNARIFYMAKNLGNPKPLPDEAIRELKQV